MTLIGNSIAEKIWYWSKSKGFNDYGASAILANFDYESGLNPKNLQDSYQSKLGFTDDSYVEAIDNGTYTKSQFIYDNAGFSLMQVTYWSRKKAFYEFAKENGKSIGDLENALEFFYKELSERYPSLMRILKYATSVDEATVAMMLKYECPYDQSITAQNKRISYGYKYYTLFVTNTTTKTEGVVNMGYKYFTKGVAVKVSAHFYSTEFDCHGNGCCSQTKVNEQLIEYLEQIREHFNAPITITSPYRCIYHNRNVVGGAVNSRHEKGDAADFVVKGHSPREVAQYCESIGILGIGLYESAKDGYFVHIDTRGYRSFWYGQAEQPRTTFGTYVGTTSTGNVNNNVQNTNNLDTILNIGDNGSYVKTMQEKLIRLGYSCGSHGADGDFGNDTYKAVRKFQEAYGLGVDGIAGHQTLTAIDKAIKELDTKNDSGSLVGCQVKVTASLLNVRAGTGTNYRIVRQIKKDTVCKVLEEQNDWCKLENPSGWVSKDYIKKI